MVAGGHYPLLARREEGEGWEECGRAKMVLVGKRMGSVSMEAREAGTLRGILVMGDPAS